MLDENSYESILVCIISYKTLVGAKPLRIRLRIEYMDSLEFMAELAIWYYLVLKNMISFTIGYIPYRSKKVVLHVTLHFYQSHIYCESKTFPLSKDDWHGRLYKTNSERIQSRRILTTCRNKWPIPQQISWANISGHFKSSQFPKIRQ